MRFGSSWPGRAPGTRHWVSYRVPFVLWGPGALLYYVFIWPLLMMLWLCAWVIVIEIWLLLWVAGQIGIAIEWAWWYWHR
jgi:hypothetical protein